MISSDQKAPVSPAIIERMALDLADLRDENARLKDANEAATTEIGRLRAIHQARQ